MYEVGTIGVVLTSQTANFVRGFDLAITSMQSFSAKATALIAGVGALGLALTAAVGVAGVAAFASFDDAMTESLSIMGEVPPTVEKQMGDLAKTLATEGVFSATQLAESYYFLASAGLDTQQSMSVLDETMRFAIAGSFDMARATDLLTDALSALGMASDDPQEYAANMESLGDTIVRTATAANASVEQFAESLTNEAGAAMKNFGVEVEQGMSILAAYASQGRKGVSAGTLFSRALRLMTKAAVENKEEFERLGIQVFNQQGNLLPLVNVANQISDALGRMSTEEKVAQLELLGFQARTQQAILPLLGMNEELEEFAKLIGDAGGVTQEVADTQMTSLSKQMTRLKNIFNVALIDIGQFTTETTSLGESLKSLNDILAGWVDSFKTSAQTMDFWIAERKIAIVMYFKSIQEQIKWFVEGVVLAFDNFARNNAEVIEFLSIPLRNGFELFKGFVKDVGNLFSNLGTVIKDALTGNFSAEAFKKALTTEMKFLPEAIENLELPKLELTKLSEEAFNVADLQNRLIGIQEEADEELAAAFERITSKFEKPTSIPPEKDEGGAGGEAGGEAGGGAATARAAGVLKPSLATAVERGTAEAFVAERTEFKLSSERELVKSNEKSASNSEKLVNLTKEMVRKQSGIAVMSLGIA